MMQRIIVWSVQNAGTTGATISGSTLNTTAAGTVTVMATVVNGASESSDYTQDFTITVSRVTNASELISANTLSAWMRDGLLHVTGLTTGETLSIYNATGVLVYQSIATGNEADIPLNVQGMYIVIAGDRTVRVVNNQ